MNDKNKIRKINAIKRTKELKIDRKVKKMHKFFSDYALRDYDNNYYDDHYFVDCHVWIDRKLIHSFMDNDAYNILILHDDTEFEQKQKFHQKQYVENKNFYDYKKYQKQVGNFCFCKNGSSRRLSNHNCYNSNYKFICGRVINKSKK